MMSFDMESLLKLSNSGKIESFLHECIDNLTGGQKPSVADQKDSTSRKFFVKDEEFKSLQKQVQTFYCQCVTSNYDNIQLAEEIPNNLKFAIKNCFLIRQNDIFKAVASESIIQTGVKLVDNIDWKLKWVIGSSKLAGIREPLLQVDLHFVEKECDEPCGIVNFEANLETIDVLIDELTKVKKELDNK